MTQCAHKDAEQTVDLRPIFYISQWQEKDLEALKSLSEIGWPVLMDAQELQAIEDPDRLLQLFNKDQLQLVSCEVEHKKSIFSECVDICGQKGWTHLIHINNFSMSLVEELKNVESHILENPWARIAYVPQKREKHTNSAVVQRLLDLGEKDYRNLKSEIVVYPIFYIQNRSFNKSDLFVHEKLLIHCLRGECEHKSFSVDFTEKTKTDGMKYNWKKTLFDWWLIALTSLQNSSRPLHSSLSLMMGVFIACTPFYGLQTFLIIACAFIFRLNFAIAFLGSQVSLPPIYTLIVPLQVYVGFQLTGTPFHFEGRWLEMAQTHFTAWLLGSVIVGSFLSLILGSAWYLMQFKPSHSKVTWSGNMRGSRLSHYIMSRIIKWGGLPSAYFMLYFIVPYFYIFAPKARRGLNEYYRYQNEKVNWFGRQSLIVKHLYRFAQVLVDQVYQALFSKLVFNITYREGEVLKTFTEKTSQILIFSHFGGWGLTAQGFSRKSFERTIYLIRYRSSKISTESVVKESSSEKIKILYFEPGEPIYMGIHEVLSAGNDMALMGDRPFDNNFELVPFLGRLAPFPSTPFRLAKTYQLPLSLVLGFKENGRDYCLISRTINSKDQDVYGAISLYVEMLEKAVRAYPKQWFNHYSFWSKRPTRPDGSFCQPSRYIIKSIDSPSKKLNIK